MSQEPFRILPRVTPENEYFWRGGAEGELRFLRCRSCRHWIHPPSPRCPDCLGEDLAPEPVSGRAVVHTFTVNHHPWIPGFDPPYVVAIVELEEQAGLRLTTNIVGCSPDDVSVDMPVEVVFDDVTEKTTLVKFRPPLTLSPEGEEAEQPPAEGVEAEQPPAEEAEAGESPPPEAGGEEDGDREE